MKCPEKWRAWAVHCENAAYSSKLGVAKFFREWAVKFTVAARHAEMYSRAKRLIDALSEKVTSDRFRCAFIAYFRVWQRQDAGLFLKKRDVQKLGQVLLEYLERLDAPNTEYWWEMLNCMLGNGNVNDRLEECELIIKHYKTSQL